MAFPCKDLISRRVFLSAAGRRAYFQSNEDLSQIEKGRAQLDPSLTDIRFDPTGSNELKLGFT